MIGFEDLPIIGLLIFLEGILSVDNALVLALLARPLPKEQQRKALTYGLVGAFVFRFLSLFIVSYLIRWTWVKYVGGGYLLFLAFNHFFKKEEKSEEHQEKGRRGFWRTVIMIELMDIAFAVDSILAAVALSSKFWVVFTGGVLGVILMRFAASFFIVLLQKFPRFESSAYLLIFLIGSKLILEALRLPGVDFHSFSSPAALVFWGLMGAGLGFGFIRKKKK